jgi:hypothetical protein
MIYYPVTITDTHFSLKALDPLDALFVLSTSVIQFAAQLSQFTYMITLQISEPSPQHITLCAQLSHPFISFTTPELQTLISKMLNDLDRLLQRENQHRLGQLTGVHLQNLVDVGGCDRHPCVTVCSAFDALSF